MLPFNARPIATAGWAEDNFVAFPYTEGFNLPFYGDYGVIQLDSLSQQSQMDEMALNNQLSHMVTSIQQQQDQLQQKIYADM